MRRLHSQFYLAILAALAVFVVVAGGLFWAFAGEWHSERLSVTTAVELAQALLPPASASAAEQQQSLDELERRLRIELALYDREGQLLAATPSAPRPAPRELANEGWTVVHGAGRVAILPLDDGRRLVVRPRHPPDLHAHMLIALGVAIVLAFALGAYPIARRLTGRLERLQSGVEQLGQGALATRVPVEGRDEVAALARSFNRSAERIEELVKSYKLLLANCSHELRTPLARIRLGLERLAADPDDPIRAELTRSVAELATLIDEMLLASRLDALRTLERAEEVDLLAVAAEEAAHFDRSVEGQPIVVHGDPGLLRRMIRNLLANAERHGGGASRIHVDVDASGMARLLVEDRGPGVAEGDRERIFEPFVRGRSAGSAPDGVGLGLAIVRQIARAHGGEVSYAPAEAGGSRFTVTLPATR